MSKRTKMDERQIRATEHIGRIRQAILRMRGKYRLGIASANGTPVEACRAIAALWGVLGLEDAAPGLHGDPVHVNLKGFRNECYAALELLDEAEAFVNVRDAEMAGLLLPKLFERVNRMWRCCCGLKAENASKAAAARVQAA